jgi:hypothetical protein
MLPLTAVDTEDEEALATVINGAAPGHGPRCRCKWYAVFACFNRLRIWVVLAVRRTPDHPAAPERLRT